MKVHTIPASSITRKVLTDQGYDYRYNEDRNTLTFDYHNEGALFELAREIGEAEGKSKYQQQPECLYVSNERANQLKIAMETVGKDIKVQGIQFKPAGEEVVEVIVEPQHLNFLYQWFVTLGISVGLEREMDSNQKEG